MSLGRERAAGWITWLDAACAAACVYGFHSIGALYAGFPIAQGTAVFHVDPSELSFACWYLLFGSLTVVFAARALAATQLPRRLLDALEGAFAQPRRLAMVCAQLTFGSSLLVRGIVLSEQAIADDELTYDFIAATLLEGRIWNAPPIAAEFLKNQFVIATEHAWYGKYPIGHPLLLALGKAIGLQSVVVPLIGALGVWLTFAIGKRVLDERRAAFACVLLALSPHYVLTHGTQLSQPTSMLCMLAAMGAILRLTETGAPHWAALAGAALGYGLLTRPLPGALFVIAALVAYAIGRPDATARARARELIYAGVGIAVGAAILACVHYGQSGNALESGYHVIHAEKGLVRTHPGSHAASIGAALLRESFWLHGWPLSLIFVPFARFNRAAALVWSMVAAVVAYRLLVPKTVVATTGPVYVLEIVPLLCLATVAGATRVRSWLGSMIGDAVVARHRLAAVVLAATAAAGLLFLPIQVRAAHRAGAARAAAYELIADAGVDRAVVFTSLFVSPKSMSTWAYFPPNPSPDMSEDLVFLRLLEGEAGYERMLALWKSRFADRRGLLLYMTTSGPLLRELPMPAEAAPPPEPVLWAQPR